jgi:hypothetical protein
MIEMLVDKTHSTKRNKMGDPERKKEKKRHFQSIFLLLSKKQKNKEKLVSWMVKEFFWFSFESK